MPSSLVYELALEDGGYRFDGEVRAFEERVDTLRILSGDNRGLFYLYTRQQGLWPLEVVGHDPGEEPGAFDPFWPLRNVTKDYPPTVLLHGDEDTDVPFEQSVLMADQFERHGVQHEFIEMAGRGHGFDYAMSDPVVAATFDRVLTFLEKRLRA